MSMFYNIFSRIPLLSGICSRESPVQPPPPEDTTIKKKLDPENEQEISIRKKLKTEDLEATDQPERSSRPTTIDDLPPDILLEFFSRLSIVEVCLTVSLVCKTWYLLSRHRCLWKHLSFKGQSVTTEHLCLLLSHATDLHSLQLVDRMDVTAVLHQVAFTNRSLRILIVKRCAGSEQQKRLNNETLLNLIKRCKKLVEITIKATHFYSPTFFKIMCVILPDLKRINFNDNIHFGTTALSTIAYNCKPLEEVCVFWSSGFIQNHPELYEQFINDNDIIVLCTRMKNSLKVLKISAWVLSNNVMKSIVQCTLLRTLRIRYADKLTDDGILQLTALHNLSSLEISHSAHISSEGWQELFNSSTWESLTKLSLNCCDNVDNNALENIGNNCPNLKSLSLSFCKHCSQKGLTFIIKGCKQLTFLRVDFAHGNIVRSFSLIPKELPNLKCLVYDTGVPRPVKPYIKREVANLKEKLPNLRIRSSI